MVRTTGTYSISIFEKLPMMPRFTIEAIRQQLDTTFPTATAAVMALQALGIVTEITGQKKNRQYSYQAYVELLSQLELAAWPTSKGVLGQPLA